MNLFSTKKNSGFVILFAVTLSAILLAIALGVMNIALKEIKFGTSAKDANNAFFATDTGIECALLNDKFIETSLFVSGNSPVTLNCSGVEVTAVEDPIGSSFWDLVLLNLGSDEQSCAHVTVDKTSSPMTTVISKGYSIGDPTCSSSNPDRIERELKVSYRGGGVPDAPPPPPPPPGPPFTPTGLTATTSSCGTGTINVSWNASTSATSYTLRDGAAVIYTGAVTSFSHTGLVAGSSHSYSVLASNTVGSSAYSSPAVSGTAPAACVIPPTSHFTYDPGKTLDNGLAAYWKLNEVTGTRAASFGAVNLTSNNNVSQALGKVSTAADFTTTSSQFLSSASNVMQVGNSSFTFAGWFYLDSSNTTQVIFGKDNGVAAQREYRLLYDGNTWHADFAVYKSTGVEVKIADNVIGSLSGSYWNFFVVWYDASLGTINISINGNSPATKAVGGPLQTPANVSAFTIGSRQSWGLENYLDGRVDELGFWKRALNGQERSDLYHAGAGNTYNP